MKKKRIIQSCLKSSAVALILSMLLLACDKQEPTPEASITLTDLEGDSYHDISMPSSDPTSFFVKIKAKKGVKNLQKFGHTHILNKTDTLYSPHLETLVDQEREGFERTWFSRFPADSVKGKVIWEFYIIDEDGKKTAARLNMDVY